MAQTWPEELIAEFQITAHTQYNPSRHGHQVGDVWVPLGRQTFTIAQLFVPKEVAKIDKLAAIMNLTAEEVIDA